MIDVSAVLRVMSFNIRYAGADDAENDWSHRRRFVIQTIKRFGPDLLATQEVLAEQLDYVRDHLAEYDCLAVGREDGVRGGESTAVFYRAKQFELCREEHFWLSETPHIPGSISWGASQTRLVTGCCLRLRRRPAPQMWFFNTHFDHRSELARTESARLVRQRIEQLAADTPVILAGDFNATEHEPVYHDLLVGDGSGPTLIDAYRVTHPTHDGRELTRHDFRAEQIGSRIDWILHSSHFTTNQAAIERSTFDGRFPSDHYPVTAVIRWQEA